MNTEKEIEAFINASSHPLETVSPNWDEPQPEGPVKTYLESIPWRKGFHGPELRKPQIFRLCKVAMIAALQKEASVLEGADLAQRLLALRSKISEYVLEYHLKPWPMVMVWAAEQLPSEKQEKVLPVMQAEKDFFVKGEEISARIIQERCSALGMFEDGRSSGTQCRVLNFNGDFTKSLWLRKSFEKSEIVRLKITVHRDGNAEFEGISDYETLDVKDSISGWGWPD